MQRATRILSLLVAGIVAAAPVQAQTSQPGLKFAGALSFTDAGILFVGDNHGGAIYAFDTGTLPKPDAVKPVNIVDIDVRIADVLGVAPSAIAINDMATHPTTSEIYISVTRVGNFEFAPAIMKVSQSGDVTLVDLAKLPFQRQALDHYPDQKTTFKPRGFGSMPPRPRDIAKGEIKLSSLAIMDIKYHRGEIFVAGVAYDNFLSSLRRIPYPFNGKQSTASVEIYHLSHDQNETRAPIRAMSIHEIDGRMQMVAAYTCSPIVLIGLDEIKGGAKITGRAISDYGNGQPLDMIPFRLNGQELLFLTNNSRSPQVIPVSSMNGAKVYTRDDVPRGGQMDLSPQMPIGPVGKTVMFDGMSMHMAALGESMFVSITRDLYTGRLNLDSNPTMFPNRLHNLVAEYDFPQYQAARAKQTTNKN